MSDATSTYDKALKLLYGNVRKMIKQEVLNLFGKNLRAGRLDASAIVGDLSVNTVAVTGATTTTTAPGAGAAGALPATPAGYMTISVNGTPRLIPYY